MRRPSCSYTYLTLPLVAMLTGCAPITPLPQPMPMPTPSQSAQSLPSPSQPSSQQSSSSSSSSQNNPSSSSSSSSSGSSSSMPSSSPGFPSASMPSRTSADTGGNSGINSPNPTTSRVDLDSDASGSKSSQDGSDSEDIGGNNGWLDDGLVLEDDWQTSNQLPSENGGESADESGSGQSNSDGAASTESELQQVLSDLDGNIIEQRSILRGRNDTAENAGNPDSEEIGPAGAEADATSATAKRSSQTSTRQNQPQISNLPAPPSKRGSKVPENIPDARDDDIIARQLREAAMQEEDEELREKLWEEYRRYKKG